MEKGPPPHQRLQYELAPGSSNRFVVSQELTLFRSEVEVGRVTSEGRLLVEVEQRTVAGYGLMLRLGPLTSRRQGDTRGVVLGEQLTQPVLLRARIEVSPTGSVRQMRVLDTSAQALARGMFDTLLGLAEFPLTAVGAGARWRSRQSHASDTRAQTQSEIQVLELTPETALLRVWRQQVSQGGDTEAIGEWTFQRERWPVVGSERVVILLPEVVDRRALVSFGVQYLGSEG